MRGNPELCNTFYADTLAINHMTHQIVTRMIAKTEFILGLISLIVDAIAIDTLQHVQQDIADVIVVLETLRSLARAAEADAELSQAGVMTPAWTPLNICRNWYPKIYQRMPEIMRKLGASGLIALPTEADIRGVARDDVDTYLISATMGGRERVRMFRLAWDLCASSFAGRQALYEYYSLGDPVRMASAMVRSYDRQPYKERVQDLLEAYAPWCRSDTVSAYEQ